MVRTMKKGKLLLLLALILCLSVFVVACAKDGDGTDTGTDTAGTQVEAEPQQVKHEMHDYLVYVDDDVPTFTTAQQLEGELVDYDTEHDMAVMKTKDVDVKGNLIETYKVYDLVSGEVIFQKENTALYYSSNIPDGETKTTLSVEIQYPVIRAMVTSERGGSALAGKTYKASFYEAKKDGELIYESTDSTLNSNADMRGNLYAVTLGDKLFWIDKNMDVLRQVEAIHTNGYDTDNFSAEHNGYLYSYNNTEGGINPRKTLQIFDRDGLCALTYTADDKSFINCYVLNDGNVLVQQNTLVDIHTEYDYIAYGYPMVYTTYIVNAKTGEMKEIEFEYVIRELESAYTEDARDVDRIFTLAEGRQNKAVVVKVANKMLATTASYVVLDNDMKVEYVVNNGTQYTRFEIDLKAMNPNLYSVDVADGDSSIGKVFDLDGSFVCYDTGNAVTDRYVVGDSVIYDHKMNKLYDAQENKFEIIATIDEMVFLEKINFVSGATEIYVFDVNKKTPVLLTDGINTEIEAVYDSYYILKDNKTETYTLYSADGTLVLTSAYHIDIRSCENVLIAVTEFNGKDVAYVIK